jgi:hypothetical protein
VHGLIAVADALYQQQIERVSVLAVLKDTVEVDGQQVDCFSYENPLWLRIGVLVLAETRRGAVIAGLSIR